MFRLAPYPTGFTWLFVDDRAYRKLFWGWFALMLGITTAFLGGNRALPEFLLTVLLLIMAAAWALRVVLAGRPVMLGPRTPHLVAIGFLLWTVAFTFPLSSNTAARISSWSAWGQELNWELNGAAPAADAAPTTTLSIDAASSRRELRLLGAYYLFFLLVLAHLSHQRDLRTMLRIVTAIAVAEAIIGCVGVVSGSHRFLWLLPNPVDEGHRHFGTFVNPNHAGTFLGVGIILWFTLALLRTVIATDRAPRPTVSRSRSILTFMSGGILVTGLILTGSHGALLATAIPLVALTLWSVVRFSGARRLLASMACVVLVAGLVAYPILPKAERTRQVEKLSERGRWLAGERPLLRWAIWRGAYAAAAVAPWTGSGPGTIVDAYRPFDVTFKETIINSSHNTYLDLLVERGLIGVAIAALGIGWLVCALGAATPRRPSRIGTPRDRLPPPPSHGALRLGLCGAAAVVFLHAVVDFPLQIPAIALLLTALVAALVRVSWQWRPRPASHRLALFVPFSTLAVAVVLVASEAGPLAAAGRAGRMVRRDQQRDSLAVPGDHPNAELEVELMTQAAELHNLRAHNSRAAAFALQNRMLRLDRAGATPRESETLLHDALEMAGENPFCVEARLAAATAAAHCGDGKIAAIEASQARRLDPGHAATHYVAGRALLTAGEGRKALMAFADSLNASPRFVFDIARIVGGRRLCVQMLDLPIGEPRSLCWLGMCLPQADRATKRRVAGRLDTLLDARAKDLTTAERLYLRGQSVLWLLDRPLKAVHYFEESLVAEPLVWIRWHLAQAYLRADRPADANAQLQIIAESVSDYLPPDIGLLPVDTTTKSAVLQQTRGAGQ